jgi:hypothetical protein
MRGGRQPLPMGRAFGQRVGSAVPVGPTEIAPRPALILVAGNAIVMGAAGVSVPVGWLLLPGVVAMNSRPRLAVVVALWAAVLILLSVLLPNIPGHPGDGWSLATSGTCLALTPALACFRRRARLAAGTAGRADPTVRLLRLRSGRRCVALAVSRLPDEVTALVELPNGTLRLLLAVTAGEVPAPDRLGRRAERAFTALASAPNVSLEDLAAAVHSVVRRHAPHGQLPATLVQISPNGKMTVLRCGGPEIIATPAVGHPAAVDLVVVVDPGPGNLPLGLMTAPGTGTRELPDNARIAVVTSAYSTAHHSDYLHAVHEALRANSLELGAVQLLQSPREVRHRGTVVGPTLVIGAVTPPSGGTRV